MQRELSAQPTEGLFAQYATPFSLEENGVARQKNADGAQHSLMGPFASSSRTAYPSPPAKAEVSLTPSLVLPPQSPAALRGPRLPTHSNERRDDAGVIVHKKGHRPTLCHSELWNTDL